jgi:hypothetical protein
MEIVEKSLIKLSERAERCEGIDTGVEGRSLVSFGSMRVFLCEDVVKIRDLLEELFERFEVVFSPDPSQMLATPQIEERF